MSMIFLFILSVYLPIDSWQNDILEEIQVRGMRFTNFPSIRPYETKDINISENDILYDRLRLLNLSANFSRYDPVRVLRLKPTIFYDWSAFTRLDSKHPTGFTVFIQPVVKFGEDSLPPSKEFMDLFSSDYERAYMKLDHTNFNIFIGRERFAIGPSSRYNLLLSGYSTPMDWFSFSLHSDKLKFSFYLSRLDDLYTKPLEYAGDMITDTINAQRYLTVKRFDYSPAGWLNFGVSESAIFGGENYSLEIFHFNPVVFIQAYQYNWNKDVNFFLNIDGKIFLKNLAFYVSLLIDDFQLEQDPNNEPNHLGMNFGVEFADPLSITNTFWLIEYTAVTRYTYCHFIPYQRYHNYDTPIGSPYGPDYDEIYTKFIYHLNSRFDVYSQISHLRKGESRIDSIWPIPENPRVSGTSFPEQNFLTGVVQKSSNIGFGFRYFHSHWFVSEFLIGYSYLRNFGHEDDITKKSLLLKLQVDLINL